MILKKIIACLLIAGIAASLVGCGGDSGETADTASDAASGNIEIPDWDTDGTVAAPDLSELEEENGSSWGEATASSGINTSNYIDFTENSANAPDINNITIDTKNGVVSSTDREMILGVHNKTGWEIVFSTKYVIKKIGENHTLTDVPFVDSPDFGDAAYLLGTGKDSFAIVDLSQLQNHLDAGNYMIGLNMICNGYYGDFYIYTTFTVK